MQVKKHFDGRKLDQSIQRVGSEPAFVQANLRSDIAPAISLVIDRFEVVSWSDSVNMRCYPPDPSPGW
jgi:hypothetical protein